MPKVSEKAKEFTDARVLILTSILSALGFILALFWRDLVVAAIEEIVPQGEGLFYKLIAAVVVTIVVVIIAYVIVNGQKIAKDAFEEYEEKLKKKEVRLKEKEKNIRKTKKK